MAAITHVRTLDDVATMLGENVDLLQAIISNDDNLSYGTIIRVITGPDEAITALTDHGVEELADMLYQARLTTETWQQFLDDFVDDPEIAERFKINAPR